MPEPAPPPVASLVGHRGFAFAILACLALVMIPALVRTYRQELQLRTDMDKFTDAAREMDDLVRPYAATGNIWLAYQGYTDVNMTERFRMLQWYTRATYTSYPVRVYVADADTAVPVGFSGNPIPPFLPTPEWLAARNVRHKLVLRYERNNDISLYYQKL